MSQARRSNRKSPRRYGKIRMRRIAILVADGINGEVAIAVHAALAARGAAPRYVGPLLGAVRTEEEAKIEVEVTLQAMPAVVVRKYSIRRGRVSGKLELQVVA